MQEGRLRTSPIGQLVPFLGPDPATQEVVEGLAFLPDDLPRDLTLSTSAWTQVNDATAALARLDGAARLIPEPGLLRQPTLRREAQSTSALEGTFAPFVEVMAAGDEEDATGQSSEMHEILNFERCARLAFSWPDNRELTVTQLGELQKTLVSGTAGELSDAGDLRDRVVVIGARGQPLSEARFVPPPPGDQLRAGVESLLIWLNNPPNLPSVVQAALVHYQFETLHPFSDGNGRIGRLLVIVHLLRGAIIREPLLVVSPWFERNRERYQDLLLELSCSGDWQTWVEFFARGVAASATESQSKVEALMGLQQELRERVQKAKRRGSAESIAAGLVGRPFVTGPEMARRYGLTEQGATNSIQTLVELGILEQTNIKSRSGARLFVSPDVMTILDG